MTDKLFAMFPVTFEALIYIINDEGQTGKVTYSMALGDLPTKESVLEAIDSFSDQLPDGFRLMDKREFFEALVLEKTGDRVAIATSREFDE